MVKGSQLKWQIGILEAKVGKGPSLTRAKLMVAKQQRRQRALVKKESQGQLDNLPSDPGADEDKEAIERELQQLRYKKAAQKLHHIRKELRKQCKKVKVFETQKMIKRIKACEEKELVEKELKQDEAKLKLIKGVDLDRCADEALDKIIAASQLIEEAVKTCGTLIKRSKASKEPDEGGVDAGLRQQILNHKSFGPIIDKHVHDLTLFLEGKPTTNRPKLKEAGDRVQDKEDGDATSEDGRKRRRGDAHRDESDGEPGKANGVGVDPGNSMFVGNLADLGSDTSDVNLGSDDDNSDDGLPKPKKKRPKRGSPDDWEDPTFDEIYGVKSKKNRPGQRARQKMWEKRYGKEANHIKIRTRETKNTKRNERNTRQDLQQLEEGSKGDDEGSRQKPLWGADKLARAPRSHNSQPQGLHPSWAAKKQTQKVLQAKPQGQLVVFDDDGNAHVPSGADPSVKKKKEETVHPSWAAKMRERQRLTSIQGAHMQGQKIVFDFD